MIVDIDTTPQEWGIIEQCCAWLDDEQVEDCLIAATDAANEITQPELAQEKLVEILTDLLVRKARCRGPE
jgi:hypothetical protein